MRVSLVGYTDMKTIDGTPEKLIASAAKVCYSSKSCLSVLDKVTEMSSTEAAEYIDMLMSMGHESPLEHISFTFTIEGISRACSHQLVRHRVASYSQKSQRYVDESQFRYVTPGGIACSTTAATRFRTIMAELNQAYLDIKSELALDILQGVYPEVPREDLLEKANPNDVSTAKKQAQEDARYVLPNACETQLFVTMNARELLHFFEKRCCNRAQWEIRAVAKEMLEQCKSVAPNLFRHAGAPCTHKACPEGKMSCGHPQR